MRPQSAGSGPGCAGHAPCANDRRVASVASEGCQRHSPEQSRAGGAHGGIQAGGQPPIACCERPACLNMRSHIYPQDRGSDKAVTLAGEPEGPEVGGMVYLPANRWLAWPTRRARRSAPGPGNPPAHTRIRDRFIVREEHAADRLHTQCAPARQPCRRAARSHLRGRFVPS